MYKYVYELLPYKITSTELKQLISYHYEPKG
jgi:hypothetical protein